MTELTVYQVDAFTQEIFKGNPASVVPLQTWLPDEVLLGMAKEHNQSETAYFVPVDDGLHDYELRWFTTHEEVELCGHATLAAGFVIFHHLAFQGDTVRFKTRFAGDLSVNRAGDLLTLNFPARIPVAAPDAAYLVDLIRANAAPTEILRDVSKFYLVYTDEKAVMSADPDFGALKDYVCVTAPGSDCDFVSRFFTPGDGYNEDPVTGSTHCALTPYWSKRLNKTTLSARQLSERGGRLSVVLDGDRVRISGHAILYSKGQIYL